MPDHRAVGLPAHEPLARDEEAAVGKPVNGPPEAGRALADDLASPLDIDGDDLARSPMRKPQTALVPTRRLADHETAQQRPRCNHRRFLRRHLDLLYRERPNLILRLPELGRIVLQNETVQYHDSDLTN